MSWAPTYQALRFYSPVRDANCERLSMADSAGREFFAVVEVRDAPGYREMKARALEKLLEAIMAGDAPGEVTL